MKVLLATDGSDCANEASLLLGRLKFHEGAELFLLTVTYDPADTARHSVQPWFADWEAQQKDFVAEHHAELEKRLEGHFASITSVHRHGPATHEILEFAGEADVDLIVLGATGRSMLGRALLGSVSDNVATHAKCSVIVVRPRKEHAGEPWELSRLAITYDGSIAAREAVEELKLLRWDEEVHVDIITVLPKPDFVFGEGLSTAAIAQEEKIFANMRESSREGTDLAGKLFKNASAVAVDGQHVGDVIVQTCEGLHSDLVVVGDAGHNLMYDWLIGSTTKYVLRHAHGSVWISRHHRS